MIYKMKTSVIISIIFGVLLFAAIIAIIVIVVVGKKDLKNDFKTLLKYGRDQLIPSIPSSKFVLEMVPDERDETIAEFNQNETLAKVNSINLNCTADVFENNFNTEQQITILGILSTILDGIITIFQVKPPQNIKNILSTYSMNIGPENTTNLLVGMCNCTPPCASSKIGVWIPVAVEVVYAFINDPLFKAFDQLEELDEIYKIWDRVDAMLEPMWVIGDLIDTKLD